MFYDFAKIHVAAGKGGDGAMHMHRAKYVPRGGPDGGDGGRGGSIYILGDSSQHTLLSFRFKRLFKGEPGKPGGAAKRHGAAGADMTITVPIGTVVRDVESGEEVADVLQHGQRVLVARGGKGGLGNVHFATSVRRTPEFATRGEPGQERDLELELRVVADAGLVGYPNAGKSSLISAISAARPKIADYPFTTLEPYLGVVGIDDDSFVVADIPGLIEGASTGSGLGLRFLRHLERARLLIHVLDAAAVDGRDPMQDFDRINEELRQYSVELATRPRSSPRTRWTSRRRGSTGPPSEAALEARGVPAFPISAATREGLEPLLRAVASSLAEIRRVEAESLPPPPPLPVLPETQEEAELEGAYGAAVRRAVRPAVRSTGAGAEGWGARGARRARTGARDVHPRGHPAGPGRVPPVRGAQALRGRLPRLRQSGGAPDSDHRPGHPERDAVPHGPPAQPGRRRRPGGEGGQVGGPGAPGRGRATLDDAPQGAPQAGAPPASARPTPNGCCDYSPCPDGQGLPWVGYHRRVAPRRVRAD